MLQMKWIWKNMQSKRSFFIFGLIFALLASFVTVAIPMLTKEFIDRVIDGKEYGAFVSIAGAMIALKFVRTMFRYLMVFCLETASQFVLINIQNRVFETLITQEPEFFDKNRTGDIISRVTGDLDYVRHVIAFVSHIVLDSLTTLCLTIVVLLTMHVGMTICMLIITPLIFIITYKYSKKIKPCYMALRNKLANINTVTQENIAGNRVVKAFAREEFEKQKFEDVCQDYCDYSIQIAYKQQIFSQLISLFVETLSVIMILCGGYFVITSGGKTGIWQMTIGELVAFSEYRWSLATPLRNLANVTNDLQRFFASAEKIMEIYYSRPIITDRNDAVDTEKRLEGKIKFENVRFAYNDKTVFNNINFEINSGETVAIMGPTGSGKTALINLLCRLYEPNEGKIYIDGVDVHLWKLSKLHRSIGVAMQDVFLFSDTVKNNVSYGNPVLEQPKIEGYSKIADADDFIKKMDDGYETIVGERGVGLSGGQRQRIALARALAVQPPILVLDDTTSAVDMETEKHIQEELQNLDYKCTKIIVAQRISSVKTADRIFVLSNGEIEIGTHETLSAKDGYYRDICILQDIPDIPEFAIEQKETVTVGGGDRNDRTK